MTDEDIQIRCHKMPNALTQSAIRDHVKTLSIPIFSRNITKIFDIVNVLLKYQIAELGARFSKILANRETNLYLLNFVFFLIVLHGVCINLRPRKMSNLL